MEKEICKERKIAQEILRAVNSFSFKPAEYAIPGVEECVAEEICRTYVWLMANNLGTDGRNEDAKAKSGEFIETHPDASWQFFDDMLVRGKKLNEVYPGDVYSDSSESWVRRFHEQHEGILGTDQATAIIVALFVSKAHRTLQQTFAKHALFVMAKSFEDTDYIERREYRLPLI